MVDRHRWALRAQIQDLQRLSPVVQFMQARQRVDELAERMTDGVEHELALRRERLAGLTGRLEGVNPLATLERGYAIVHRRADGQVIHSTAQVQPGQELRVRVSDGTFEATAGRKEDA
jgi:exodeoxyribonuclease VII large subunit